MVAKNGGPTLRYEFEAAPVDAGRFERAAAALVQRVFDRPLDLTRSGLASSASVAGSLLGAGAAPVPVSHGKRLRRILLDGQTLLDRQFDATGELHRITYPDGKSVSYVRDDRSRLRELRLDDGPLLALERDPLGNLTSVSYAGGRRFRYRHNHRGQLVRCELPDGRATAWDRDAAGRICGLRQNRLELRIERTQHGRTARVVARVGEHTHSVSAARKLDIPVFQLEEDNGDQRALWSVLGRWVLGLDGELVSSSSPCGVVRARQIEPWARVERCWSGAGEELLRRGRDGVIETVRHSDGTRSVGCRLSDERRVLMVHPDSAELWSHDARGRLTDVLGDGGSFVRYRYDRDGRVVRIQHAHGSLVFRRDAAGRVVSIALSSGLSARIDRDPGGLPSRVSLGGVGPDLCASIGDVTRALWASRARSVGTF